MKNFFILLLQRIVPHHGLSRCIGRIAHSKKSWVKNRFIKFFLKHYDINMQEAELEDPLAYASFNAFFTRRLKNGARPIDANTDAIVSPVDGSISELGTITRGRIIQAKNHDFSVQELLGGTAQHAKSFLDGQFMTLYLAPKDYHRIHMPIDGRLTDMIYIPGQLFSVQPATVNAIPNLFARNERVVCLFDTAMGKMAVVLVGAMIVASIATEWHGVVAPGQPRELRRWSYPNVKVSDLRLAKGDALGYFELGSTVVMCFEQSNHAWHDSWHTGDEVKLGQRLNQ